MRLKLCKHVCHMLYFWKKKGGMLAFSSKKKGEGRIYPRKRKKMLDFQSRERGESVKDFGILSLRGGLHAKREESNTFSSSE